MLKFQDDYTTLIATFEDFILLVIPSLKISEPVHILLRPKFTVPIPVIHLLRIHIIHLPNRQKLHIRHRNPKLHTGAETTA